MSASPVTLVGNLTADPELKFLPTGVGKLTFGIAVNHYWTDQDGEKQEKTSFFNIVAWRNLAEDCANVLTKGVRVVVTGRLEQRSWDDKEGIKRYTTEVVGDSLTMLGKKEDGANSNPINQAVSAPAATDEIGDGLPF